MNSEPERMWEESGQPVYLSRLEPDTSLSRVRRLEPDPTGSVILQQEHIKISRKEIEDNHKERLL
jgi:hypothetical protein